jgi:hypothetical protein
MGYQRSAFAPADFQSLDFQSVSVSAFLGLLIPCPDLRISGFPISVIRENQWQAFALPDSGEDARYRLLGRVAFGREALGFQFRRLPILAILAISLPAPSLFIPPHPRLA